MPPRGRSAPRPGYEDIAAAVALTGSERAAARMLGVARSTLNGILRGVHGAGRSTTRAIENLAPERRQEVRRTRETLTAGRSGQDVVAAARALARTERRTPGSTAERTRAHEQRMAQQGLDLAGRDLVERDALGRRKSSQQYLYDRVTVAVEAGQIPDTPQDRYAYLRRLMMGEVEGEEAPDDLEPLFDDTDYDEADE